MMTHNCVKYQSILATHDLTGFQILFDPNFPLTTYQGGQATYVSVKFSSFLSNIRYSKCTIAFSFSIIPNYSFMSVYINPVNSDFYSLDDFGLVSEELTFWNDKGYTPFIGGDFNSRLGDLNELSERTLKWRYEVNIDHVINSNGVQLKGVCKLHKMLPLNHCRYYNQRWDGKFTFHKAGRQSQIDFCITTNKGRKCVQNFEILDAGWHLSDHLPLSLSLLLPCEINVYTLLLRSKELGESTMTTSLKSFRFNFHFMRAKASIEDKIPMLMDAIADCSPDDFIQTLEDTINPILRINKIKLDTVSQNMDASKEAFKYCDDLYLEYLHTLKYNPQDSIQKYKLYQESRNKLNNIVFSFHEKKFKSIIESNDDRSLWNNINWSGKYKANNNHEIPTQIMADYFEKLYEPLASNEGTEIENMHTDMYIPITDDPISAGEMNAAYLKMRKGGYDYSIDVMKLLMGSLAPAILILLNILFYVAYPIKLATSLLFAIPKKGDKKLLSNLRGIQMQPLLAILYDRIIASRLVMWSKVSPEQTAFQKGKSTIDQIFLIRTIINLAKLSNVALYIGYFDLAKAFDKVSRPLLLKTLIKLGVGAALFYAIKATYSVTRCVLVSGKKLSDIFLTFSGIKQGAPSSVILFILFMDQFISMLRQKCISENILGELHMLLHADDTAVFSTTYELFINKCNILITSYKENRLELNFKKSSFMIINPKKHDYRVNIKLNSGWLSYEKAVTYLGVIISDTGILHEDLASYITEKSKSVYVKLANFIRNNPFAPVTVKLKILKACLESSLLYGCETWGSSSLQKVETLYRKAIKITLSMSIRTPTELVYIESGLAQLKCKVYKRQYIFWKKVLADIENDNNTSIAKIYKFAIKRNLQYIRHYQKLHKDFETAELCHNYHLNEFNNKMKQSVISKTAVERNSILNDYTKINELLTSPTFYKQYAIKEYDRLIITKYRSGSHHLKIQTGRYYQIEQAQRLCVCGTMQSLSHVIFDCGRLDGMRHENLGSTLQQFFSDNQIAAPFLRVIENTLNLR